MKRRGRLTTLGRTEVFARSGSARTATTGLLNAESATLDNLALQALLGSIRLLGRHHLDETEATRLLSVRVDHDRAVLDIAVLLEEAADVGFGEARVDAGDEQVGSGVLGALLVVIQGLARVNGRPKVSKAKLVRVVHSRGWMEQKDWKAFDMPNVERSNAERRVKMYLPIIHTAIRGAAASAIAARFIARRCAAVAGETRLVYDAAEKRQISF